MDRKIAINQLSLLSEDVKQMRLAAEEWKNPWQTLIAIILSARTRDEKTIIVAKNLFDKYPDAENLAYANLEDVEKIIRPVNFYKNKSKNIINCSKEIFENHKNKVPKEEKELLKLAGVGRKTANVFLNEMGEDAIGVDTHVSYISQKLGWTKNSRPEKIEHDLEELFPKEYWRKINPTLVRFGKSHTSKKHKDKIIQNIQKLSSSS